MKLSSWDAESSLALLFFVLFVDLGSHLYLFPTFCSLDVMFFSVLQMQN